MLLLLMLSLQLASPPSMTPVQRHHAEVRAFMVQSGYPHGRAGYVVDHILPLCAGGPDVRTNMQWQERAASYQKDRYERALCRAMKTQGYQMVKQ